MAIATGHAQNVLPDPSFEDPAHWTLGDSASSIDSSVSRTGSKSLKLKNDGNKTKNHNAGQYSIGGVQPNTEYVYSVWVRGDAVTGKGPGGKPLAVVRWRDSGNKKIVDEMYMWAPYGTYGWQEMFIYLQSPPGAAKIDVSFRSWWVEKIDEGCLSGTTNWDDVSLVPRDLSHRGTLAGSYQAEAASASGGVIEALEPNFSGGGYFHPKSAGASLTWNDVSGGAGGGQRILSFRYSWEGNVKQFEVFVNGASQGSVKPAATGRVSSWASFELPVALAAGPNAIKIVVSKVTAGPNIDRLDVYYEAGTTPPPPPPPPPPPDAGVPDQAIPPKDSAVASDAGVSPPPPPDASRPEAALPLDGAVDLPARADVLHEHDVTISDGGAGTDAGCIDCSPSGPANPANDLDGNPMTLQGGCRIGSQPGDRLALLWLLLLGATSRRHLRRRHRRLRAASFRYCLTQPR